MKMEKPKTKNLFSWLILPFMVLCFASAPPVQAAKLFNEEVVFEQNVTFEKSVLGIDKEYPGKKFYVCKASAAIYNEAVKALTPYPDGQRRLYVTLDEAINNCTASRGDVIYVLPGHTESIANGTSLDFDKAGITIICLGEGDMRPTFTFITAAAAQIDITGADTYLQGGVWDCNIANQTAMFDVTADDVTFDGSEFNTGGATGLLFISTDIANTNNAADNLTIKNCLFANGVADGNYAYAVKIDDINDGVKIVDNVFKGWYDAACVFGDEVNTNMLIARNVMENQVTGQMCIEMTGASTGSCVDNKMYGDTLAAILDPGSLICNGNLAATAIDISGIPIPSLAAIGTVTAGSAEDILKKLYYGADGTGAYPATAANDSTIAKIIAKGSTATASTFDNSTDSLEALSDLIRTSFDNFSNPNYLAVSTGTFDTTGVWSTAASHEIATVTGMVRMLIIPECTASVSSVSDTGTIALGDETTGNSLIAASTLGAGVMVTGELWVDATLTRTILTQTQLNAITFVVANGKDIGYTIATNAASGGSMKFHIWWVPLDATGAVVAGAGGTL